MVNQLQAKDLLWWKGAVIYEIYLRSFYESRSEDAANSSHRGVGTLRGVLEKLDYIKKLGVDAIWITPFYDSPMKDFGYDIRDYCQVAAEFGSLEDFIALIDAAHQQNLKVIVDRVWGHTSDEHEWFQKCRESLRDEEGLPEEDWYVWRAAQSDGMPPNNWFSIFSGSAWKWDPEVGKYYLHHFLASQPALNLYNQQVREKLLEIAQFWLDLGVDGFRLDAVPFWMHNRELENNPPRHPGEPFADGFSPDLPLVKQRQVNNIDSDRLPGFLREVRRLVDSEAYSDRPRLLMGEVAAENSIEVAAKYTDKNRLHTAYNFALLKACHKANELVEILRLALESSEKNTVEEGRICWCVGNHDIERVASRWGNYVPPQKRDRFAKLVMALHLCLPGSVCIYQGEELGLPQAELEYHQLRDPYDKALGKRRVGRDGARTVMPWQAEEKYLGFSEKYPWIDLPNNEQDYRDRAVDRQEEDPNSVLHAYREFIRWRKQHQAAIARGELRILRSVEEPLLAFTRTDGHEELLFVYNFGLRKSRFPLALHWYECLSLKDETPLSNLDFVMSREQEVEHSIILEPLSFFPARLPELH